MTSSSYFRYPHVRGDLITFVAEDDVWLAPLGGGRAWRVSSLHLPARNPRFSPDGKRLVWTVVQGNAPEVVSAAVDGGDFRQLTFFGHQGTRVKGFTAAGDVLVTSAFEQAESRLTWAYAVKPDGSERALLPYGPVDSVAFGPEVGDERPVVLSSVLSREPAWWKRYRGGTAGKLWIDTDGSGEFRRLVPELNGNLADPLWVGDRVAFLSDHEGHGNLYSVLPNGSQLRRHTDHEGFYVRHAATDGTRVVFESAGNLFLLPALDAEPVELAITLGSASTGRRPKPLNVAKHLGEVFPDRTGRASALEAHGTVHWLTHRDGPSRIVEAAPGVRARLARPLGDGEVVYVADHGGTEALYIRSVRPGVAGSAAAVPGRYVGDGQFRQEDATGQEHPVPDEHVALPQPVSAFAVNQGGGSQGGLSQHAGNAQQTLEGSRHYSGNVLAHSGDRPAHNGDGLGHSGDGLGHSGDGSGRATTLASGETRGSGSGSGQTPGSGSGSGQTHGSGFVMGKGVRRIELDPATRVSQLACSPDGKLVAVATEYGRLLLLDIASGLLREVASTQAGAIGELVFAPDSAWLLWAEPVTADTDRSRLRLAHVTEPEQPVIELTDGRFSDHGPDFTPDGRFVAFLSERSFDPIYDTHGFDLSFPSSTKPFLIPLAAGTPSPFGPSVEGTPAEPETLAPPLGGSPEGNGTGNHRPDPSARDAVPAVLVHPHGIRERLIPVPVAQGNYTKLTAADGALLWLAAAPEGLTGDGRASTLDQAPVKRLERFDIARREVATLVPAVTDYHVTGDGKRVVLVHEGKVRVVPTRAKVDDGAPESVEVDLSRIRVRLDPVRVWGQAFDETWRLQRDFYWAPDMAGVDWQEVYDRYRPLVERLGSHDDLVDLLWEVQGELGTSHAYVTPAPAVEAGAGRQGRLGADFRRTAHGWEVVRVLPGESSDPQARSPLAAPGVAVLAGDVLLAVDGVEVPESGPDALLAGAADKTVELTISNGLQHEGGAGQLRRVAVVPIRDEERLRYQHWVLENRNTVRHASEGRFGYLHIPDMQARGWAQLHRDLDTETAQDGLIVDVRRNRGGHTSELVAELIGRKMTAWTMARGQNPTIYPSQAPRGPVVILADEFAGSDGDIITQVAKLRSIGPVIGMRTWGGVVGIDGKFSLADGTAVTQPRYAFWFTGDVGWRVENYGVDPDIEVPFPPHAYAQGEDPQLEYGVGVLKEMLAEIPTDVPPAREGYRRLKPAKLPARP
ncbi:MAG TPA: S41 family peptidase [Micrococcaceae bacterium]|nr:S41 family peptidase [Micrococcaceae bacterium]